MLPHEGLPISDQLNSDSLKKLGSSIRWYNIFQQLLEDCLYWLTAVVVVFVGLNEIISNLVEGVMIDLSGRNLVQLCLNDSWNAHEFSDSLRVDFRLLHSFGGLGFLGHKPEQLHRVDLFSETIEHLWSSKEIALLDSVVLRAETSHQTLQRVVKVSRHTIAKITRQILLHERFKFGACGLSFPCSEECVNDIVGGLD